MKAIVKLCKVGPHPNIIQIFSSGSLDPERFYIDMEYCLGTLADIIDGQAASKLLGDHATYWSKILADMERFLQVKTS